MYNSNRSWGEAPEIQYDGTGYTDKISTAVIEEDNQENLISKLKDSSASLDYFTNIVASRVFLPNCKGKYKLSNNSIEVEVRELYGDSPEELYTRIHEKWHAAGKNERRTRVKMKEEKAHIRGKSYSISPVR